jgi:hypothetical protein
VFLLRVTAVCCELREIFAIVSLAGVDAGFTRNESGCPGSLLHGLPGEVGCRTSDYDFGGGAACIALTWFLLASGLSANFFAMYLRSFGHVAIRTIPMVVLGTLVATLIPSRLFAQTAASPGGSTVVIALLALFAVPLALPSLFEIPLAFSILAVGAPLGAAAAVLFAGPIANLPSLLVVGRSAGWRLSALLGSAVWVIAFLGGIVLQHA